MNYVDAIINLDIQRVDGIEKDPERVRVLLQSLARNISTLATAKTIMGDMQVNESSITTKTLNSYLNALRRLFVIEDVQRGNLHFDQRQQYAPRTNANLLIHQLQQLRCALMRKVFCGISRPLVFCLNHCVREI